MSRQIFALKGARREMKTLVTTIVVIIVLAVCGTAALAADFVCTPSKIGDQWTYTLRNNHASYDIVEWRLCWDANDAINAPIAAANFTRANASYIAKPTAWDRSDDPTEPRWWTDDAMWGGQPILRASGAAGQKSFTIVYKSPTSVPAGMFKVGYVVSNSFQWSSAMNVVPEPGSIAILLSGLAGTGLFLRRKIA